MRVTSFLAAGIACVMAMAPVIVQAQDYLEAFKAYQEAMQDGDSTRAIDNAEEAWELAEAKGDVDPATLAILAQNIAYLTVFDEPKRAIAPAERALELGREGYGTEAFSLIELEILAATAICLDKPGGKNREALLAVLDHWWAQDLDPDMAVTDLTLTASTKLAQIALEKGAWNDAGRAISPARKSLAKMSDVSPEQLGAATIMEAAALLNDGNHFMREVPAYVLDGAPERPTEKALSNRHKILEEASRILSLAEMAFPQQESIETYDPVLANVTAWNGLTNIYAFVEDLELTDHFPETFNRFKRIENECPKDFDLWEGSERQQPTFPSRAASTLTSGSILIGYHLDAEGNVEGERILAEIPDVLFGDLALTAVGKWKANVDGVPESCRRNQTTAFQFSIKP